MSCKGTIVSLRLLYKTAIIVFALSVYSGYLQALSPFMVTILSQSGYTHEDVASFYTLLAVINVAVGYGLEALNLVASYHAGKTYMLSTGSILKLLLLLTITVFVGNTVGYLVAQVQFAEYAILDMEMIVRILGSITGPILWSLVGILAGNYKRESDMRNANKPSTTPRM